MKNILLGLTIIVLAASMYILIGGLISLPFFIWGNKNMAEAAWAVGPALLFLILLASHAIGREFTLERKW